MSRRSALLPRARLIAAALFAFAVSAVFAADAFNYTVRIINFDSAVYTEKSSRFRLTSTDPEFTLMRAVNQKIISSSLAGGKRVIEIRTGDEQGPVTTIGELSSFLADTRFLNLSSPEITGCAAKLKHAADPVTATINFVYGHILDKDVGIPIIPAVQVYRMRRGDCTEHTVLAVAILRKLGVPARAVVGMYLARSFRDERDVFVYHMWGEAFVRGRWRIVDAANPGASHPNRYVAFAGHNLKSETPLSYLRAISAIQDLSVAYLGR